MTRPRCDLTAAWKALRRAFDEGGRGFDLRAAFAEDAGRFDRFSLEAPCVFADLSKNRWDDATRALLLDLARERGLEARRDAMFAGEPINLTEGRA
ncbi:MAG: glucose-6-phosphate isomerase, partial [Burkholderiaceae bacterium]